MQSRENNNELCESLFTEWMQLVTTCHVRSQHKIAAGDAYTLLN